MTDYKAIFDGIESTLIKIGSAAMPADQIRAYLDNFKRFEGRQLSDDEYHRTLVDVVFYAGFRAATVTEAMERIHHHFSTYGAVAKYGDQEEADILNDPEMIKNRKKVRACIKNARTFENIVQQHGSFRKYIENFEPTNSDANLMRLKEELQERFLGLGPITTYHFLTDIGMPVLKPDRVIQRIFTRLGLVNQGGEEMAFVREGRKFSQTTGYPIRYIDIVFVYYVQSQSTEVGLEHGICLGATPNCSLCGVAQYCSYHQKSRTAA